MTVFKGFGEGAVRLDSGSRYGRLKQYVTPVEVGASQYGVDFREVKATSTNRQLAALSLQTFTPFQLVDVQNLVAEEIKRREGLVVAKAEEEAKKAAVTAQLKDPAVLDALSNFFSGCAHAMACRAVLRWSKGHKPFGTTATDGKDWSAHEGARIQYMFSNDMRPKNHSSRLAVNPLVMTTNDERLKLRKPLFVQDGASSAYSFRSFSQPCPF